MSELRQRINEDIKKAMRAQDKERLITLRLLSAEIKQQEVDNRIQLDDNQILALLDKIVRRYRDSIEQFSKAGRIDLVNKESQELRIVMDYMPMQMDSDEINQLVVETVAATNALGIREMGKVMNTLKPKVQGRADMNLVSKLLKQYLTR